MKQFNIIQAIIVKTF